MQLVFCTQCYTQPRHNESHTSFKDRTCFVFVCSCPAHGLRRGGRVRAGGFVRAPSMQIQPTGWHRAGRGSPLPSLRRREARTHVAQCQPRGKNPRAPARTFRTAAPEGSPLPSLRRREARTQAQLVAEARGFLEARDSSSPQWGGPCPTTPSSPSPPLG